MKTTKNAIQSPTKLKPLAAILAPPLNMASEIRIPCRLEARTLTVSEISYEYHVDWIVNCHTACLTPSLTLSRGNW